MILVARVGSIGQIQLINTEGCGVSDNTLIVNAGDLNHYIYYFLKTLDFKKITSGTTQPLITGGGLKRINVPLLPSTPRDAMINLLTVIEQLIKLEQKEYRKYVETKTFLLDNMFV